MAERWPEKRVGTGPFPAGQRAAGGRGAYAPPTPTEVVALARYAAGWVVSERLSMVFLLKWLFAVGGVVLVVVGRDVGPVGDIRWLGIVLLVVFAMAWLVEAAITTVIRRLSVGRRHREAVEALEGAKDDWWPRLRAEVARVGLPNGRLATMGLMQRWLRRRLRPHEVKPVAAMDVRRVIGEEELRRARRLFAASRGTSDPTLAQRCVDPEG